MHIVWFKRDLRIEDHEALSQAAKHGPVLPLYILEPELWRQNDMSHRHYIFLQDCLLQLNKDLEKLGQRLIIKVGNTLEVLDKIIAIYPIEALWSHQETWNNWTYERDKSVRTWCKSEKIVWHEPVQNGVIRRLRNRNGWAARWHKQMQKPLITKPLNLVKIELPTDVLPSYTELGLNKDCAISLQKGGRLEALQLLNSFLYERGQNYTKDMSSPITAFEACSRLSPHLAFGTLSIREVFKACAQRNQELKTMPKEIRGKWPSSMRSFTGRLRWHCHFIQKLEDEPLIEFKNMHPIYDTLRQHDFNQDYFEAWKSGMTGYPMVDACMRALIATGWLNFRMRAMLMSFASYHLWLHWREPALYLANLFTDYEPGIHYSQIQMQSGTTGINAIRIYNPIKQGIDQDPEGVFIKTWLPELKHMDKSLIHTPWHAISKMNGYPMPIIDEKTARKFAAEQLYGLRKDNTQHKEMAQKIFIKHGSRKSKNLKKKPQNYTQGELPL